MLVTALLGNHGANQQHRKVDYCCHFDMGTYWIDENHLFGSVPMVPYIVNGNQRNQFKDIPHLQRHLQRYDNPKMIVVANEFWPLWSKSSLNENIDLGDVVIQTSTFYPNAKLIYSDYRPWSRMIWAGIIDFWDKARSHDISIDGFGLQIHVSVDRFNNDLVKSIEWIAEKARQRGFSIGFNEVTVFTKFQCWNDKSFERQGFVYAELAKLAWNVGANQFGFTAPFDFDPWCWDYAFKHVEQSGLWDVHGKPKPAFWMLAEQGLFNADLEQQRLNSQKSLIGR